jgi:hypothetical protein
MSLKIFDVLQQKRTRLVMGDYLRKVKEQGALRIAKKAMRSSERVLF